MLKSQSEPTPPNLVFRAPLFRVQRGLKVRFTDRKSTIPRERPTKAAVALAMGYRFRRAAEQGETQDFAALAKKLKVSRAWVSMTVILTFLAPKIQEKVILGRPETVPIHELVRIARLTTWTEQLKRWENGRMRL